MNSTRGNLHGEILQCLSETLTDPRSMATEHNVNTILQTCPPDPKEADRHEEGNNVDCMTERHFDGLKALIRYCTHGNCSRDDLIDRLLNYLEHLPSYTWEETMRASCPALADSVTFSIISGMLHIASKRHDRREQMMNVIRDYGTSMITRLENIDTEDDDDIAYNIGFSLPSLAGWFRALQLSPCMHRANDILNVWSRMKAFAQDVSTLERVRQSIRYVLSCRRESIPQSQDRFLYCHQMLEGYWKAGIPFSNNRIVYDLLILLRNSLARNLRPDDPHFDITFCHDTFQKLHLTKTLEHSKWSQLLDVCLPGHDDVERTPDFIKCLSAIYVTCLEYYQDVKRYTTSSQQKIRNDGYLTFIMGLCLQVAALASVHLKQVDEVLIENIKESLFDTPSPSQEEKDAWIYIAALDAAAMVSIKFPRKNGSMIDTICRFLAIPSTVFYFRCDPPDAKEPGCTSVRRFAIMRLAQCIQINQDMAKSQIAVSTLYSLLNQMTQYDHEEQELLPGSVDVQDIAPRNQQLTAEQREQLCINALSAIIGIAVRLEEDDITNQALSMLVLRRRVLSKTATLALVRQLVDLALVSPIPVFADIINVFSIIGRESLSNRDGVDELTFNTVIESQLDLAQRLSRRPEHYAKYLDHMLMFFVDAGMLIQHIQQQQKEKDECNNCVVVRSAYLARMLPVIQALLQHDDFNPQHDATEETVTLFRNMWFHCILFDFVDGDMRDCLLSIAKKTPPLVTKAASDHLESDLEYNSVLVGSGGGGGGGSTAAANSARAQSLRQRLTTFLGPNCTYSIRNMPFSQVMFTLAVYHLEIMRSFMGDCSFILHYYSNDGIGSEHSYLGQCLQTMVDLCVNTFIKETQQKAANQVLNDQLCTQMQALLPMCCHRLRQVHLLAIKVTNRLVNAFPQVFSEKALITLLLELIQLTWLSCEACYRDEYTSIYRFTSDRAGITLELSDYQAYRQELCSTLYDYGKRWLIKSMDMACKEVTGLLQDYLAEYKRFDPHMPIDTVHLGRSLALEIGKTAAKNQLYVDFAPNVSSVPLDASSDFVHGFTTRIYHTGEINGMNYVAAVDRHQDKVPTPGSFACYDEQSPFGFRMLQDLLDDAKMGRHVHIDRLHGTMLRTAAAIVALKKVHPDFIAYIVRIPVYIFTAEAMEVGTNVWNWILIECPEVEERLMIEMLGMWQWTQRHRKGLFSPKVNFNDPFEEHMTYKPSDKSDLESVLQEARSLFIPHLAWIEFIHSRFNATRHMRKNLTSLFIHLLGSTFRNAHLMSTHSLSRQPRFHMLWLGLKILETVNMEAFTEHNFRTLVYEAAFSWFCLPPKWHYGPRKSYTLQEYKLMTDFYHALSRDTPRLNQVLTSSQLRLSQSNIASGIYKFVDDKTRDDVLKQHKQKRKLLLLLVENELSRLSVWCNPLNTVGHGHPPCFVGKAEKSITTDDGWKEIVRFAWQMEPKLAVQLGSRFVQPAMFHELHRLIANNSLDVVDCPDALVILLGNGILPGAKLDLKYLQYWSAVPAITAANYFLPPFQNHPSILQYAMRVLEYYPVDLVFFYVPQIVQALRYDEYGYVEKYIMEAGQVSQLFAHQIIWNMQANFYIDADKECKKADPLKPTLERIIKNLVDSFTGEDRSFYEREFKFFGEVTAISGYLKEYIKFGQTEKKPLQKQRLDEELAKIKVEKGVYLPSNPDGEVKEIDRSSGKPLQSHAKAPFMATFKIQKADQLIDLGAIFKVGDDCRQDVLALQLIAVFKNIFTSVGLDLYLYPYRVVATAPGRGVIDVIRNAISRDQLGREKVNNMYDYFVAKYGTPDTPAFQRARTNFVQSLAAYSVLSYLLQFKDRHNGNIMIDSEGHILHIDFGFIFDIAPGGITFESSPFKLTTEMVQVMGGGADEQAFNQFSQLVVKAYLACRPYAGQICQLVTLMLESGLPCFKGETIQRMQNRFQLGRSERAAADFIMLRIKDSCENRRTVMYDYFQKLTNGIPY